MAFRNNLKSINPKHSATGPSRCLNLRNRICGWHFFLCAGR